jgi:hypothetical protein
MGKVKNALWLAVLMTGYIFTACAGGGTARTAEPPPLEPQSGRTGGVIGIDWFLLEVRTPNGEVIVLDREKLEAEGMGDVYSLRFDGEDRASGKAAPNRYSAPCGWGDDSTVGIGLIAATKMLALKEPESLKEPEFFDYLSKITRWAITDQGQRMELYNYDGLALVFVSEE